MVKFETNPKGTLEALKGTVTFLENVGRSICCTLHLAIVSFSRLFGTNTTLVENLRIIQMLVSS